MVSQGCKPKILELHFEKEESVYHGVRKVRSCSKQELKTHNIIKNKNKGLWELRELTLSIN